MQNINKWRNQIFCFRVSILFILLWLAVSSAISLIFYFALDSDESAREFIINFSTWLFVIPSITFFGLINTIPLIIDWVSKPLEQKEKELENTEVTQHPKKNTEHNLQQKEQNHEKRQHLE